MTRLLPAAWRRAWREAWCGWRGHATLLRIARWRLWVCCLVCGFESPGLTCPPTWHLCCAYPRREVRR